jgi:hypothetical protein
MEPSREPDTGTACLCRLPSRKGSGRRRVGSPSRCGCTDLITWSPSTLAREAARAAGKRTASSWRPPSPWIPRPRRVVAFPFALEASLAARKRTSSRWKLLPLGIPGHRAVVGCPPDGGSLPRRREADGVTLDPPLAADTGTAPRRRLPLRRGKLPRSAAPQPEPWQGSNGRISRPTRARTAPKTSSSVLAPSLSRVEKPEWPGLSLSAGEPPHRQP